jgi:hypothetical protein
LRSFKLTSFTAGALCMLILGSGSAVAATGGKFILGRSNSATTTTTLTNSKGTALSLKAPSGKPALAVSNKVRVPNLNADAVDGLSSESFARATAGTGTRQATSEELSLDPASNGAIDTLLAVATCPAGTRLTGGGLEDYTQSGVVVVSAPDPDATSWEAMAWVDPAVQEDPTALVAWAMCLNPKGAVSQQAAMKTTAAQADDVLTPQLVAKVSQQRSAE